MSNRSIWLRGNGGLSVIRWKEGGGRRGHCSTEQYEYSVHRRSWEKLVYRACMNNLFFTCCSQIVYANGSPVLNCLHEFNNWFFTHVHKSTSRNLDEILRSIYSCLPTLTKLFKYYKRPYLLLFLSQSVCSL